MSTNPLKSKIGADPMLKQMTPAEKVEWANRNIDEVNAQRARDGMWPVCWVFCDGRLMLARAPQ